MRSFNYFLIFIIFTTNGTQLISIRAQKDIMMWAREPLLLIGSTFDMDGLVRGLDENVMTGGLIRDNKDN